MRIVYGFLVLVFIVSYNSGYGKTAGEHKTARKRYEAFNTKVNSLIVKVDRDSIGKIRSGDSSYLKSISYDAFSSFIASLNKIAKELKMYPLDIILQTHSKPNVLRAFVGGIYNKDPRVRITCALLLQDMVRFFNNVRVPKNKSKLTRKLIKERHSYVYLSLMLEIHPKVREVWYLETVNREKYKTVNFDTGEEFEKNAYTEINLLDILVIRKLALYRIKEGRIKVEDFKSKLNNRVFISIATKLSKDDKPPVLTLDNSSSILINSLEYDSDRVKKMASDLLVEIYYNPKTNNQIKNEISRARKNHKVLDERFNNYRTKNNKENNT